MAVHRTRIAIGLGGFLVGAFAFTWWFLKGVEQGAGDAMFELDQIYDLAERGQFDEIARITNMKGMFEEWQGKRGAISDFRVTGTKLWWPVWGEVYGVAIRNGKAHRVTGYYENGRIHYLDEDESKEGPMR